MKDLSKYLIEASKSECSLNKYQVEYLENNWERLNLLACSMETISLI